MLMKSLIRSAPRISRAGVAKSIVVPVQPKMSTMVAKRFYSADHVELDPANAKDYDAFVKQWHDHFKNVEDEFELERGLNHIFYADWVPALEVVEEALKASRRLNSFATAVRTMEALEDKAYKKEQYEQYVRELKPLLTELGIPERKELGEFDVVRDRDFRNE